MPTPTRALALHKGQFNRLIKIAQSTSRYPERDVLVLMLGHHCGLRVTEISRITVADVMYQSGKLRSEVSLREVVTKGCKQRCAYLVTKHLVDALEAYLSWRLAHESIADSGMWTLIPQSFARCLPLHYDGVHEHI